MEMIRQLKVWLSCCLKVFVWALDSLLTNPKFMLAEFTEETTMGSDAPAVEAGDAEDESRMEEVDKISSY